MEEREIRMWALQRAIDATASFCMNTDNLIKLASVFEKFVLGTLIEESSNG